MALELLIWNLATARQNYLPYEFVTKPITVAARNVFASTNTGIVGSNPTRGMDVCVHLFCVCVGLCVGSSFAKGWSLMQGVLPTVYRLRNWKSGQGPKDCRAIERKYNKSGGWGENRLSCIIWKVWVSEHIRAASLSRVSAAREVIFRYFASQSCRTRQNEHRRARTWSLSSQRGAVLCPAAKIFQWAKLLRRSCGVPVILSRQNGECKATVLYKQTQWEWEQQMISRCQSGFITLSNEIYIKSSLSNVSSPKCRTKSWHKDRKQMFWKRGTVEIFWNDARVRVRVRSCGIYVGQSNNGAGFFRVLRFPLPIRIPSNSP
jgi:hypothetical protein